jgi:hypothetical protein
MPAAQKGTTDMTQNGEETMELLVLDQRRDDWTTLVAEAGGGTAVLLLDRQRDGLREVLEVTQGRAGLARIRIADAGSPGRLSLGGLVLDMPALAAREAELAQLGDRIAPGGVLELCGGGGGASAAAGRFVAALARLLGRDVRMAPGIAAWGPGAWPPAAFVAGGARSAAARHRQA